MLSLSEIVNSTGGDLRKSCYEETINGMVIDEDERVDIQWECYIGDDYARWEMFPTIVDPFELSILASVYIQKEELKG